MSEASDKDYHEHHETLSHLRPKKTWLIGLMKGAVRFPQSILGPLAFALDSIVQESDWQVSVQNISKYRVDIDQVDLLSRGMNAAHARHGIRRFTDDYHAQIRKTGDNSAVDYRFVDMRRLRELWDNFSAYTELFLSLIKGLGTDSYINRNLLELEGGAEDIKLLVNQIKEALGDKSLSESLEEYKLLLATSSSSTLPALDLQRGIFFQAKNIYMKTLPPLSVLTDREAEALFEFFHD